MNLKKKIPTLQSKSSFLPLHFPPTKTYYLYCILGENGYHIHTSEIENCTQGRMLDSHEQYSQI